MFTSDDNDDASQEFSGRQKSGKAGGEATKQKHGTEFFREIGKKGGEAKGDHAEEKADPGPTP